MGKNAAARITLEQDVFDIQAGAAPCKPTLARTLPANGVNLNRHISDEHLVLLQREDEVAIHRCGGAFGKQEVGIDRSIAVAAAFVDGADVCRCDRVARRQGIPGRNVELAVNRLRPDIPNIEAPSQIRSEEHEHTKLLSLACTRGATTRADADEY